MTVCARMRRLLVSFCCLAELAKSTGEAHVPLASLVRRFRESRTIAAPPVKPKARTVGEMLKAAGARATERHRQEAERAAREKARHEREALEARDRHLAALAKRETEAWRELDALIATKQPYR